MTNDDFGPENEAPNPKTLPRGPFVLVSRNFIRLDGVRVSDAEMVVLRTLADRCKANDDTEALQC